MVNILKGILISISLLVPGVSGGTMMIVLNVYDKSIEALSALISRKLVHIKLLIQLAIGGIVGLLLFSRAMSWALDTHEDIMGFLFLGIVIAGLYAIIKKVKWKNFKIYQIIYLIVGILIAMAMTNMEAASLIEFGGSWIQRLIIIIIAGIIIAVALILPGISTSFLLLALGIYGETLNAINTFDVEFLLPLAIGVIIGVLLTTKLLEYCMKCLPNPTYLMILGFILGSVSEIFPGVPSGAVNWFTCILAFVVGLAIMIFIQLLMKKYPDQD